MSDQYLRKASLVVASGSNGLDLSELQFQFHTYQSDLQSPNNAIIRVLNLSDQTGKQIKDEFTRVVLQAGYQSGNFGIIHDGQIKQVRRGRLNATDTFLDIFTTDSDLAYNFGITNTTLAAGSRFGDQLRANVAAFAAAQPGVNVSYAPSVPLGPALPRGKVLFGMARDNMRDLARTQNMSWSIQNGQVTMIPETSYLPGEAVVLTSKTGMLGMPEQTDNGIRIKCLLNQKLVVGGLVKIDNASIIPAEINLQYTAINNLASLSADGFYKIYVSEHKGDTRGNDWETKLVCFAVDVSAPAAMSVKPYGG